MDVGYSNTKGNFSLRAAALIIHDNDLLLAQNDQYDCYYTVGGGIQQNETSENAVIRECYEETGCHFEIDRLVFVQERLYKVEGIDHHEIVFFYLMKKRSLALYNGINTDQKKEHLHWIPIDELGNLNIVPAFIRTAVKNLPKEVIHIISHE